jgi:hypothetical protein
MSGIFGDGGKERTMQVSAYNNPYQYLQQYQQPRKEGPVSTPVEPRPPVTIPEYERPTLPTEAKMKLQERVDEKRTEVGDTLQSQKDAIRQYTAAYVGAQSKKTQFEIYMNNTTDSELDSDTPTGIEFMQTLRDIQKQNNTIKAFSAYQDAALRL